MKKVIIILITSVLLFVQPLFSHPHVYIDMQIKPVFTKTGFAGLEHRWTLLKDFSNEIKRAYDTDKNGIFSLSEQNQIFKEVFKPIEKYYYYTIFIIDENEYVSQKVSNFKAEITEQGVVYSFFVMADIPYAKGYQDVTIAVYDKTHYVSFGLEYLAEAPYPGVEYETKISYNDMIYSHRHKWGSAFVEIEYKSAQRNNTASKTDLHQLNDDLPYPFNTETNPFIAEGSSINFSIDKNPFLMQ
jgi:ABC-type uncharacterized transport system substrate-binding protein